MVASRNAMKAGQPWAIASSEPGSRGTSSQVAIWSPRQYRVNE